jgi:hypothetical protein
MAHSPSPTDPAGSAFNASAARQGGIGRRLVWLLVFATLLAGIGLLFAWTWAVPNPGGPGPSNVGASIASTSRLAAGEKTLLATP